MIEVVNWFTFVWLTLILIYSVVLLMKRNRSSIHFIIIVFYVFFAIPLFFEVFIGTPRYDYKPGFQIATNDFKTNLIYCVYISIVPLIWFATSKPKKIYDVSSFEQSSTLKSILKGILVIFILSPTVALLFAPDPGVYLNYAVSKKDLLHGDIAIYHQNIATLSTLSVISLGGFLILSKKNIIRYLILFSPFYGLAVWANGKRFILVLLMVIIFYILWQKGILKGIKLIAGGLAFIAILLVYSYSYELDTRYTRNTDFATVYQNNRIDYGRDDVTKMTIYSELEGNPILEYRGQSLLFYITMFIPREIWQDKPWPYAIYITATLTGETGAYFYYGWSMTTSILEEAISNFGWIGMLIGPLLISFICRTGDKYSSSLLSVLTVIVGSLLLVLQMTAFAPLILMWIFIVLFYKVQVHTSKYHGSGS
jgi:hypothetical protein